MNTRRINMMVAGALAVFGLCACDDETTAASESPAMSVLESGKKLGDCTKNNVGEMVYVSDFSAVFYCADGKWQMLNGKDGADGKDGSDGKDGADGENGADGQGGSPGRDTVVVNPKDTVVVRDTVVVVNRDTVVIKESSGSGSSESSGTGTSLTGKTNWVYLNPAISYGEIADERDGQVYKTVKIGDQVWMAENLNFEYKVVDESTGKEKSIGNYCNKDGCLKFGRYYSWAAAMDSAGVYSESGKGCGYGLTCTPVYPVRGVCPEGWHLPDSTEWEALYKAVGSSPYAMQAIEFEKWLYATNAYGFSALPAGNCNSLYGCSSNFENVGSYANFWSSSAPGSTDAYYWNMGATYASIEHYYDFRGAKYDDFAVRCLKDSE